MPAVVKNNINQLVFSIFQVAEIIANPRPFVAVSLQNLASQKVLITGLAWSIFFSAPADAVNAAPDVFIQRGLVPVADQPLNANTDECIFFQAFNDQQQFAGLYTFPSPIILQPSYAWGIAFRVFPRAAFAAPMQLFFTVQGVQVSEGSVGQLPELR